MTKPTYTLADATNEMAKDFGGGEAAVNRAVPTTTFVDAIAGVPHVEVRVVKLPNYHSLPEMKMATIGAAGVDLFSALSEPVSLNTMGKRAIIPTGIAIELPVGYEAQVRPRSGLAAKHGITVLNSPGTIDSDYRGEIGVILVNLSTTKFVVERGMRIAQLVVKPVVIPVFEYVDALGNTERGEGGFGSTGQ